VWGREEVHAGFWWRNLRGKRPLGRPRHRWEDNIKVDLQGIECVVMHWIDLPQDRDRYRPAFVDAVMSFGVI